MNEGKRLYWGYLFLVCPYIYPVVAKTPKKRLLTGYYKVDFFLKKAQMLWRMFTSHIPINQDKLIGELNTAVFKSSLKTPDLQRGGSETSQRDA